MHVFLNICLIFQLQTTQIIAAQAPVQQVGQTLGTVSGSQAATLVKTVSTPAGSVTIPVSNVNISVSMQQKGGLGESYFVHLVLVILLH